MRRLYTASLVWVYGYILQDLLPELSQLCLLNISELTFSHVNIELKQHDRLVQLLSFIDSFVLEYALELFNILFLEQLGLLI